MEIILSISLMLNLTPNTLGWYGLILHFLVTHFLFRAKKMNFTPNTLDTSAGIWQLIVSANSQSNRKGFSEPMGENLTGTCFQNQTGDSWN